MSLEKKDVRFKLSQEAHEKLRILASSAGSEIGSHAEHILEKAIIGDFHVLSLTFERMVKSGLVGNDGE